METSAFLHLPQEIRDMIYTYIFHDSETNPTETLSPLIFFPAPKPTSTLTSKQHKKKVSVPKPDILQTVQELHSILNVSMKIKQEAYTAFLFTHTFILDIPAPEYLAIGCKTLSLFLRGLGPQNVGLVQGIGFRLNIDLQSNPDTKAPSKRQSEREQVTTALNHLVRFQKIYGFRPKALVLEMRVSRPKSPVLGLGKGGRNYTPRNEDGVTVTIFSGEVAASKRGFLRVKDRDFRSCEGNTVSVLEKAGRVGGSEGEEWVRQRRMWWENSWLEMEAWFQGVLEVMREIGEQVDWIN